MKTFKKLSIVYLKNVMKILYELKNNLQILKNNRWNVKWMENWI
mgnify:CR=1 FL=1